MGVYDCLILDDCGTANICSLQNFFFFFSLEFGFRKSQAEFPLLFAMRAGKCVTHHSLAGIRTAPGVSLEADSTSLQQPVGPEQATSAIPCSHTGNQWQGHIWHELHAD